MIRITKARFGHEVRLLIDHHPHAGLILGIDPLKHPRVDDRCKLCTLE